MDNPNFIFLKEDSSYYYEKCSQIDLLIAMGLYEKAIASSRKIMECIVDPDPLYKSLNEYLEDFSYKFDDKTLKYIHDIRKKGNKAVHANKIDWKKEQADSIARKLHHVAVTELYKKKYHHEDKVPDYVPIDEDNEWFISKRFDAKFIGKVLKSADEDYLEVIVKEQVARNNDELKQEFTKEMEKIIKEHILEGTGNYDDLKDELTKEMEKMIEVYGGNVKPPFMPDEQQKKAIKFWRDENNNLIIKAGPGSGKTSVLVERVKFLINEKGADPESILLITFTEKAANELRERLCGLDGLEQNVIDQIHVSTIHGFCRTVLKKYLFNGLEIIDDQNNEKKVMFIKNNREYLGLDDKYGYVPNEELQDVAKKFDELDSFRVNPDDLIEYIEDDLNIGSRGETKYRKKIDDEMVDDKFPEDSLRPKQKLIWQKHKFLTIVKAYKKYLELIEEQNVFDFNRLQSETKKFLIEHRDEVPFTNILIDEFQDTDFIQMEIFSLLQKNSDSVTYVGDQDQSIFSWRGSNPEFFDEFTKRDDFKLITLKNNYRSSKNIVDFNEYFMSKERGSTINFKVKNQLNGDLFYMDNEDALEEIESIINVIKFLKDNNRIKTYSDIAIISNSVVYKNELFLELEKEGIPYTVKGLKDFKNAPEVKGFINLIWYLTESMGSDEFNLNTLTSKKVNEELFNFHEDTIKILKEYDDFKQFSMFSAIELNDIGIHEKDLDFFIQLNKLKAFLYENDNELTLLDVFYKLLKLTDYIESKYEILSCAHEDAIKNREILNISLLSHKINSYMIMNGEHDLEGLFEYLIENYQDFSSPLNDMKEENRVHILTSHKAKGLEFPIVIVCSLSDEEFPKERLNSKPYKIPFNFLYPDKCGDEDGKFELMEIEKKHLLEEQMRVLYVSLTRAQRCLILSTKGNSNVVNELSEFDDIKELTKDNLNELIYSGKAPEKKNTDLITLSFTSFENYSKCSHLYNLIYNYNFITPQNESMHIGSIAHDCLDAINTYAADDDVDEDRVAEIIETAEESNPNLKSNEKFQDVLDSVEDYYYDFVEDNVWKVLHSEYPFTISKMKNNVKYNITGKIDLIIQEDEDNDLKVSIVDYKTSADIENSKNFLNQLHIYAMSLEYNSEFEDKDIQNLIVYSLTDPSPVTPYKFDVNRRNQLEEELYDTAKAISYYKFSKTKDKSNCKFCPFRGLCK